MKMKTSLRRPQAKWPMEKQGLPLQQGLCCCWVVSSRTYINLITHLYGYCDFIISKLPPNHDDWYLTEMENVPEAGG